MSVGPITPPGGGPGGGGVPIATPTPQGGAGSGPPAGGPASAQGAPGALQAALSQIIGQDLAAQDSLAPLLADLAAALQSGDVPAQARATAQQILSLQAPLDGQVTPDRLRAAVAHSGLFLEAGLASAAQAPNDPAAQPFPAGDLKALLLRLPLELAGQSQAAAEQATPQALGLADPAARRAGARPPPPVAGGSTAGQRAVAPSLDPALDAGSLRLALGHEAHAALARLELMQLASTSKPGAPPRWSFELPVAAVPGQAPGMAQFEISRDAPHGGGPTGDPEPVWRARFSLHLDETGPVHAEVALHGTRTRVTLWAEQEGARASLEAGRGDLTAALAGPEGGDAAVRVVAGAPPRPEAQAGQLIDRTS
ncbi:flagellar hook-length control protein FliK [Phenylobacterium montanum]|uniref:Flagellar hook-length control protein FliK n=1 Tax=Phenylobacterium montanum TaxID=2823693 RepID=A0A975FZI3_9CAUL|nr:flagellar hook-length control protein FliK [Caulobacter sp. S6]QUD87717.1 flagellar hook-length control protein FliK [Caulobacter sp. S6]